VEQSAFDLDRASSSEVNGKQNMQSREQRVRKRKRRKTKLKMKAT